MPDIWYDVDAGLAEVPVNIFPLIDDTDFKSIENAVAYNAAGMALYWHFVTTAGAYSVTAVTPTTGGAYDWTDQGDAGIYTIEIPASGGASINNDTEGFGWFTGKATGVLAWRGPTIGFRAAGLNNLMIDDAYSATRGLSGTALPAAAADAAGGLVISDAGGLDIDAKLANTNEVTAARMGALTDWINGGRLDLILDIIAADTTTDIPAVLSGLATAAALAVVDDFLDTEVAAILAAVDTEVAAILADTNELQTDWVNGGRLDLILDARSSQTSVDDLPTNAELASALAAADDAVLAAIAALNNLSAAQVNAEVVDALNVDTYGEPTGAPAATASLVSKIGRNYQALRNKLTVTASSKALFDDAGNALWSKGLTDDGTTYTEAEGA